MTYSTIPFQIAGSTYQSRSKPLSSQQTVNWYQQYNEEGSEQFVLLPFPGLKQLGEFEGVLTDRGLTRMAEVLYQLKGQSLYEISSDGEHTLRATVPGYERCIFANDGTNLIIVTSLRTFVYSSDTRGFYEPLGTGVTGAISVDFINNQFLFANTSTTFVAYIDNLTKEITTDGQIGEETDPDNMVRDFVFEQTVWRMGVRTISGWYNNAAVIPPISRLDGQLFNVGLQSKNSVASTDEYFYWLGDDKTIYRARSGIYEKVSTDAISNSIESMDNISNAYAYTFTLQGQSFYAITFPSESLTLVVNESLGMKGWFELSSGLVGDVYQGSSLINCYSKNIVADKSNGKLYTIDINTYTNDSDAIKRTRVTKSINGKIAGNNGLRVQVGRVQFIMETGTGVIYGQGEDPRIMLEYSVDGGKTWPHSSWARIGRLGENTLKVEFFKIISGYDIIFRLTTTDPVSYSIFSASIDVKSAGR